MIALEYWIGLSALLFLVGAFGVLTRHNAIMVLMSIELMLNAANINFVAFSHYHNNLDGQIFALFIIALAAAEVAVGLAILLAVYQRRGTIQLDLLKLLRW